MRQPEGQSRMPASVGYNKAPKDQGRQCSGTRCADRTHLGRQVFSQVETRALCLREFLQSQDHKELRSMMSPCQHARGKCLHLIASSIVAKRPSPCSGKGVRRTGGAYLKQTAVLPRSGNEIQPPHSCQHFAHVRQGLHGVTDSDYSSPGEGYSRRK